VVALLASPPAQLPSVPPTSSAPLRAPQVHRARWHTGQRRSGIVAVRGWRGGCWALVARWGGVGCRPVQPAPRALGHRTQSPTSRYRGAPGEEGAGLYARLCTGPHGAVIGLAGGRWHHDAKDWVCSRMLEVER
jgi:hypothetical protein